MRVVTYQARIEREDALASFMLSEGRLGGWEGC